MDEIASINQIFSCLSKRRNRDLLSMLGASDHPISTADLATRLVARETGTPLRTVPDDAHRDALVALHHDHLQKLADCGLIEWSDDGNAVSIGPAFSFGDGILRDAIRAHERFDGHSPNGQPLADERPLTDAQSLDSLFGALAHPRRRAVLAILGRQFAPMQRGALAQQLLAELDQTDRAGVSGDSVEEVLVSLHHVHLPHLDDAGLVEYDRGTETVGYVGHPALRVEWLESSIGVDQDGGFTSVSPAHPNRIAADPSTGAISTLHGRGEIVPYGQSLCERADEELFLLFTTTDLLEEGCFRRIQDALDRGVSVYLGSQDPAVRDLVRERAPDVVVWEPRRDWLTLPTDRERVGRLVFADREAILLGTIGEMDSTGRREETAIVGTGRNNGLVVLVRELLGPRLDHLDHQSPDFLDYIQR